MRALLLAVQAGFEGGGGTEPEAVTAAEVHTLQRPPRRGLRRPARRMDAVVSDTSDCVASTAKKRRRGERTEEERRGQGGGGGRGQGEGEGEEKGKDKGSVVSGGKGRGRGTEEG